MRLHIRRLKLVILGTRVVIIPPDARCAILVEASGIRESICSGAIKNFAHESIRIVYHSHYLQPH